MTRNPQINQLKIQIKDKAEAIGNCGKNIQILLEQARQEEAPAEELRRQADNLKDGKDCLGREQRALLLAYAWLRNRSYREVEHCTHADNLEASWGTFEAMMIRENLAEKVAYHLPVNRSDVLIWMTSNIPSELVAERRTKLNKIREAEQSVTDAVHRLAKAKVSVSSAEELLDRLVQRDSHAIETARMRKENAIQAVAIAERNLEEMKQYANQIQTENTI
jgi:hypothetical protein